MATTPESITFNWTNYKEAVKSGNCYPPGIYAPFINVDPKKYADLNKRMKLRKLNLSILQERFGEKMFNRVRGAMALTIRHGRMFLPAYQFLVYDVLHGDWLAEVDGRGPHRDHVIHHPMSAYVGLSLLKGRDLSQKIESSSKEENEEENARFKFYGKTLLEHCVHMMAKSPQCQYLRDHYQKMNADPRLFDDDFPYAEMLRKWLFLDTFFLAALFHDIGYPWKFISKAHSELKDLSPTVNPITQDSKWIARHYNDRLVFYPLRGYKGGDVTAPSFGPNSFFKLVDKTIAETHGLHGAIALLHLNDMIRKYPLDDNDNPCRRFCIEWAAMAVMMHDMAGIYGYIDKKGKLKQINPHLRLSFSRDPLSTMLTLTDKIQEFERPYATFRTSGDETKIIYDSSCREVEVSWNQDHGILNINYKYKSTFDYLKIINKFRKEEKLYLDSINGYLDFSDIGIRKIKLEAVPKL